MAYISTIPATIFLALLAGCAWEPSGTEVPSLTCSWQVNRAYTASPGECVLLVAQEPSTRLSGGDGCGETRHACLVLHEGRTGYVVIDAAGFDTESLVNITWGTCRKLAEEREPDGCHHFESE